MNIQPLQRTKPEYLRYRKEPHCQDPTQSPDRTLNPGARRRCSRLAVYEVNGRKLCKQHAAERALYHLLNKRDSAHSVMY